MVYNKFKGMGIALITPFTNDGCVDFTALRRVLDYQLSNGTDFLCILATTAETPTLSAEERQQVKDIVIEKAKGKVPILMGCGGNNTAAVVEQIATGDFDGIDGILSVCPYYNKPSQEGLFQHFKAIAEAAAQRRLSVVLYNVPGRVGVNMTAETTLRLANACENIVAIKEASGNFTQIEDIINPSGKTGNTCPCKLQNLIALQQVNESFQFRFCTCKLDNHRLFSNINNVCPENIYNRRDSRSLFRLYANFHKNQFTVNTLSVFQDFDSEYIFQFFYLFGNLFKNQFIPAAYNCHT